MNEITIQKELQPVANEALTLKIKSQGDMLVATDILSRLNSFNDKIAEERERITKPLNEALKVERSRWKPIEGFCLDGIEHIRKEMVRYQTEQVTIEKAMQQKIADKLTAGKISMDKAVAQIEKVKTPDKTVTTSAGAVQFRETKRYEVMDLSLIFTKIKTDRHGVAVVTIDNELLTKYILPNDKAITEAMKAGIEVPGIRYYTEQIPINYRS